MGISPVLIQLLTDNPASVVVAQVLSPVLPLARVVGDGDVHVVEDVVGVRLVVGRVHHAGVLLDTLGPHVASHREPGGAVLLVALDRVAPGQGHVIHDPVL